ncbi:hypothetical protein FB45DRAFT_31361 [Roridomyces roridus]|uniref:Uncharacterized protein n=1 Tax=Roridomyces roridus TaxID=1738132 RepID=A0AAD7CKP1_9AGAR|nr:hypothetical protein FB45DRAFT_31361 [Roridomyces roridus]
MTFSSTNSKQGYVDAHTRMTGFFCSATRRCQRSESRTVPTSDPFIRGEHFLHALWDVNNRRKDDFNHESYLSRHLRFYYPPAPTPPNSKDAYLLFDSKASKKAAPSTTYFSSPLAAKERPAQVYWNARKIQHQETLVLAAISKVHSLPVLRVLRANSRRIRPKNRQGHSTGRTVIFKPSIVLDFPTTCRTKGALLVSNNTSTSCRCPYDWELFRPLAVV